MKVLLFSNDLMPFGSLPTSGGGLRCWQLMKGLEAHGVEVVVSMPGFTYLAEKHYEEIPPQQRELLWRWETQDEILRKVKPDAVLFASNWDHYGLSSTPDVPLIIDLHGSRLIETSMWNDPVDTDRKVRIFSQADCLLTAGLRQRSYFYGWLVQAGRVPEKEHFIRYIPVSLSPESFERTTETNPDSPLFVSGGGWFPWQNQSKAIFAICNAISSRDKGRIEIYGTPHETQTLSSEEKRIRDIYKQVKSLADNSNRINVNGYVGRDALLDIYRHANVAVEVMQYNLERELAFTTRTIEYLWCGLPVLYNDFGEVSEHIRDYDAGWTVDPENEEEIAAAIEEIFTKPDLVKQKGENAKRLVQDRFSWDKTIEPLLDFLQNPTKAEVAHPVEGPVYARASFLSPKGTVVDVPVAASSKAVSQLFVIPAENIKTVDVPVSLASINERDRLKEVRLAIRRPNGRLVARRSLSGADIPVNGMISIDFPVLSRPTGGKEYLLELDCQMKDPKDTNSPLIVRGLLKGGYPYVKTPGVALKGRTLLGQDIEVAALALSFVPAAGRLYRIKTLLARAFWMIRQGQWTRLLKAALRRVPRVIHRVRQAAFG